MALITVGMATAVASLVHWTSASALLRLRRNRKTVEAGDVVEPASITMLWSNTPALLRRVVVASIFGIAATQVVLVGAFGVPVGLGFVVAAALIAIVWMFGIPLPPSKFQRGDRRIDQKVERWLPRILGAAVYVTVGIVVVRAATSQFVFARHADLWLAFGLLPLVVGVYRIHTKTWGTMGGLELVVIGCAAVLGVVLWLVGGDPELSAAALASVGVMIVYGAMPFYYSYARESVPSRFVRHRLPGLRVQPLIIIGGGIAATIAAAAVASPLTVPARIGTVAVVLLGAMLFAGLAAAAVAYAETTRPPKIVAAFRLKRTPVFAFMLIWAAIAPVAATGASNDVSVHTRSEDAATGVVIGDAWDRWTLRNINDAEPGEAIPLVFVASSGGGIRAAAWTSYVMDCLFIGSLDIDQCVPARVGGDPIAVASGVSGGSLGLAAWGSAATSAADLGDTDDWVKDRLGDDYLAGPVAWLLLVDTPRSFVGFDPTIRDRAEIMEAAWERSWEAHGGSLLTEGLFATWNAHSELPLMVFNGTSVNDPCRFNASVLSATAHEIGDTCTSLSVFENRTSGIERSASLAATQDLSSYLCPHQDVKMSTAVLMSARFPVITPSARIGGSLGDCDEGPMDAYVVDGGYLEGSGAGTLTELWRVLEPEIEAFNEASDACVVPFLIQIDNGYENPGAAPVGASPIEILVPIRTLFSSQFGRIANAREQAAIEFDRPFDVGGSPVAVFDGHATPIESRYARITTRAHPGVQAPLGWTLSNASFDDLRSQLTIEENQAELAEIQRWLTGPLTCEEGD